MIPDPTDFFSYNRYLYSRGNPVSNNDPTGHAPNPVIPNWGSTNDVTDLPLWLSFVACLFADCQEVNGRTIAYPDTSGLASPMSSPAAIPVGLVAKNVPS